MTALLCHHVKALSDAHHMCTVPTTMSVTILDHVKALNDTHHMTEKLYTMAAITLQHAPSLQACRLVLVNEHHLAQT